MEPLQITPEDLGKLWAINPLAQAQLEAIVAARAMAIKDAKIAELEAQIASSNGSKGAKELEKVK